MSSEKPVQRIARLLSTTEAEARKFCLEVQNCYENNAPPFQAIADYLEQHPGATPNEVKVVKAYPQRKKKRKGVHGGGLGFADDFSTISPMAAHDPRDFTEGLKKCPHGVIVGAKCAICDPEGFRADRGYD